MHLDSLKHELGALHEGAFGWALLCCGRDRDLAGDVLQIAYCRVLAGEAVFEGRARLRTWLFGVVRGVALEEVRRRGRERSRTDSGAALDQRAGAAPSPHERAERHEAVSALGVALQQLSPRQREVLHLVFYEGVAISEAAAVLGIGVGSARLHYERGKRNLRRLMREVEVGS